MAAFFQKKAVFCPVRS